MRVIAGRYRSRRLKGPGKLPLRPTSDRLRETLFNVLGPEVEGRALLDAYAGTGAVGIEAIRFAPSVQVQLSFITHKAQRKKRRQHQPERIKQQLADRGLLADLAPAEA